MLKREDVLAEGSRRIPKLVRFLVIMLILAPVAAWLLFSRGGLEALKLATTHQTQPFTELYFATPTKFPTAVTPNKTYTQSFVIANHEGRTKTYTYQVTIQDKKGVRRQTPVSLAVKSGERVERAFRYTTGTARSPVLITVDLLSPQQSIHFRTKS